MPAVERRLVQPMTLLPIESSLVERSHTVERLCWRAIVIWAAQAGQTLLGASVSCGSSRSHSKARRLAICYAAADRRLRDTLPLRLHLKLRGGVLKCVSAIRGLQLGMDSNRVYPWCQLQNVHLYCLVGRAGAGWQAIVCDTAHASTLCTRKATGLIAVYHFAARLVS